MKTQGNVTVTTVVNILDSTILLYARPCRQISNVQAQRIAGSLTERSACHKRLEKMEE